MEESQTPEVAAARICPFRAGSPTGPAMAGWWPCSCGAEHQTEDPAAARSGAAPQEEACSVCGNEERTAAGYLSCECPDPVATQWLRLYNLIANLAHPRDDHRENALEDEAHDLIRDLRAELAALAAARLALQQENEQLKRQVEQLGPLFVRDVVRILGLPDTADLDAIEQSVREAVQSREQFGAIARLCAEAGMTEPCQVIDYLRGVFLMFRVRLKKQEALRAELDAAEAAVTALRQDLQALPRYTSNYFEVSGEPETWIKASDLADRLAREEQ